MKALPRNSLGTIPRQMLRCICLFVAVFLTAAIVVRVILAQPQPPITDVSNQQLNSEPPVVTDLSNDPLFQEIKSAVLSGPNAPKKLELSPLSTMKDSSDRLPMISEAKWQSAELALRSARLLAEERDREVRVLTPQEKRKITEIIGSLRQNALEILGVSPKIQVAAGTATPQ
jgi:hypothetical protein